MIENIVIVQSATFLPTKDGKKQYLAAVMVGESGKENKQSIFDPEMQKIVQEAHKNNLPLLVKLEKEGNYWNIKSAEITSKKAIPSGAMSKEDAILQAVAFKGAIELEKHHFVPEGKVDTDRVLRSTRALFDGLKKMLPGGEK